MVEENLTSESTDQSILPTTTDISTDDSNLLAKPKAIDIYSRVVGNPLVGSNPGHRDPKVSGKDYAISLGEKIRNDALTTTNKYGNMQPYTYNGDAENVNFDRYYASKPFKTYGFSPYRDNESLYNEKMTFGDQFVRAASQWDNLVATGFTSGIRAWKTMFTDPLAPDIQAAEEMKKIMRVGASNTGGFGGFITNTFLNSGYTIGIMADLIAEEVALAGITAFSGGLAGEVTAPGMAAKFGMATRRLAGFAEASKNIKTGARVTELAKEGNEALKTIKETESTVSNWRRFYTGAINLVNPLENTFKALKTVDYATDYARVSKTAGSFIQDMIQLKAAVSEAKLEGGMVKLDVNENLIKQYKLEHDGEEPTGLELQKIENISNQEAFRTAFWNLPAIVTSNKLLFGVISKPLNKVLGKSTTKLMNNQVLENGVFRAAGTGFSNNVKNVVRGLKNPKLYGSAARDYLKVNFAEGIQENIQEAISTGAINHAMAVYKDPLRAGYEGYMGHFMHGLKDQFSAQGAETFAGGFVMGMFVQPIMAGPAIGIAKIGKLFNNKEDIQAAKAARDQQLQKESNTLNEFYQNPLNYESPQVLNAIKNSRIAANISEAAEDGNKKEVGDGMFEIKNNHIMTALKTGNYDAFIKQLEDYKNLSEDEAADAFKKYGLEKEDAVKLLGKMDEIISNAKQTKKNYEEVAENFPNPFDPQQYASSSTRYAAVSNAFDAWEQAQETLVFSKDLYNNYNERVVKMANTFSSISNAIGKTDAQKFMVLLDPTETANELEILKNEIKSLDDNIPEQKKLKAKKQKIRDDLLEFSVGMSNIKDAHARKDTLENIDKLHADSKALFNKYVNNISEKNNTIVFDTQVNEAYDLIKDSHLMNNEMKGLAKTINILNNPKGFLNLQERLTISRNLTVKEKFETLQNNLKLFVNVTTRNDAINVISRKTGLVIPADYILAFNEAEKNDKPLPLPTYFVEPITGDSVISGDKFNEAKDLWIIYISLIQKEAKPEEKKETPDNVIKDFDPTNLATFPEDLINSLQSALDELKGNNAIDVNITLEEYIKLISAKKIIDPYAEKLKKQKLNESDLSYNEYLGFTIEELQEQLEEVFEEVLIKPELMSKAYKIQQALTHNRLDQLENEITPEQKIALTKLKDIKSKVDKNGDFYELEGKKLDTRVTKIVDEILNKEYGLKSYNFADELGAEISKLYETLLKAPHNKTATVKELIKELKEKGKLIEIFQLRLNNNKLNKIEEGLEKDKSLENFKVLLNEYAYKETSTRGNTIDELGRQFLSGDELKKTDKITESAFKSLFNIFVEFQKEILEKGEIIVSRNLRVNGVTTDSKTFGGEMDILVITKEGTFKIYDMKTAGNWSNFGNEKDGFYKKEKYGLQLSIYKNALENLTGIKVDEIELLPIQTKEDLDGNITSVTRVTNPEIKKLKYADYKEKVEKYVPSKMDTVTPVSTNTKADIEKARQENDTLGKSILQKLGYKNENRQANGNVKGGQSGWKIRFNIKSTTGENYFNKGNKVLENDKHYNEQAQKLVDWLNNYFQTTSKGSVQEAIKGYNLHGFNKENPSSIWKFLSGGEQGEADFTIYIGSADDVLKFVKDVKSSPIANLLVAGNQGSDVSITTDGIFKARIEGASIGFSGYGAPTNLNNVTGKNDFTFVFDGKRVNINYGKTKNLSDILITVEGGNAQGVYFGYKVVGDENLKKDFPELYKNIRNIIGFQLYGDYLQGSNNEFLKLTGVDKINAKYDAELDALGTDTKTNEQKIEDLRAQEQADLVKAGINLADFEGTYGENKGNMPDDLYAVYKPIYDKYNALITDLSDSEPETQTVEQFNQLSIPEKFAIITKELEGGKVLIGTYYQASSVAERKGFYTGMPDNLTQEVRLDDGRILQASQYNNNIFSANRVNVRLVEKLINGKLTKTLEVLTNGRQFTYIRENPVKWNVKAETKPVITDLSLEDINKDINLDSLAIAKDKNYEVVYESVTKPEDNGRYMIENISKNSVTLKGLSKSVVVKTEEIKENIKEVVDNKIIPSSPVDTETIINNINTVKKNDIVIDDTLTDMEEALRIINEKLC